ncbi:MAG: MarR family transcriptional regulator [Gemmatimonadales bacterium]|nr:MAG: MarR family transcriptional regulator [Gemmatimonadales bacterium]
MMNSDKQGRPRAFRSIEQAAAVSLLQTTDAFRRRLTRAIEPFGITLQQFNVLRILRGAGLDGLATLTVANRMVERTPGVTRLLDRLEAEGLVERVRDTEDRRRVVARITPQGRSLLERVDDTFEDAEDGAFGDLNEAEVEQLNRYLGRVRVHLEAIEQNPERLDDAT